MLFLFQNLSLHTVFVNYFQTTTNYEEVCLSLSVFALFKLVCVNVSKFLVQNHHNVGSDEDFLY